MDNIVLDWHLNPPILGGVMGGGIFGHNGKHSFQRQLWAIKVHRTSKLP